ncbi:MAG: type III pantothenate kinase [Bacteroidota bacterium]
MNLAIDFGNSSAKIAFFQGENMVELKEKVSVDDLKEIVGLKKPDFTIISSVSQGTSEIIEQASLGPNTIGLTAQTPIPAEIRYKTPHTLGVDRIAAVIGAQTLFPNQNCLVIDAGTCITYDFIDSQRKYFGGAISPGLRMRFKSLNNFTARLPLVEFDDRDYDLIGDSTETSILSGIINGTVAEIQEIIRKYKHKFSDLQILICGGDARFVESRMKSAGIAKPELVLIGLNSILEYNNALE